MRTVLSLPAKFCRMLRRRLLPRGMRVEEVAFIFADVVDGSDGIRFVFRDWHHVQPDEYEIQSAGHVYLKDHMRGVIIKRAHDLQAGIVEVHSHVGPGPAEFSPSDLYGFDEFVPHVRWRLTNRPYAAVVLTRRDFDALAWVNNGKQPIQLDCMEVMWGFLKRRHRPNGLTLSRKCHERHGSF